jgi:hypothetical protein
VTDQEELNTIYHYNPATGIFTWLPANGRGMHHRKGIVGTVHIKGYRYIRFQGRSLFAHRLAFLYMTGVWPTDQIDHINGVRDDNRWCNLREATNGQNMENLAGPHGETITGVLGVTFRRGRYEARIQQGQVRHHLGTFRNLEDAEEAYRKAKARLHTHTERLLR